MSAITAIRAYRHRQPFVGGSYGTSGGTADGFDAMVVAVDTASGVTGWGEMAPLGSFYSEAFAAGARAGVAELAPQLLGQDAAQPRALAERMGRLLRGHPYVRSALDMACWDAAAREHDQPLCEALGGRFGDAVELYRSVPPMPPADAAALATRLAGSGYRRLQVKVGGDPALDADRLRAVRDAVGPDVLLVADANGGWTTAAAIRFCGMARDVDHSLEQPCATLAECAVVRRRCRVPMLLDESIVILQDVLAVRADGSADGITIKLSRVGGITPAALLRDVANDAGLVVTVEDTGGASIDTAAMVHVSLSTPERVRGATVDFNAWVTADNATGMPAPDGGRLAAPAGPGLGVEVRDEVLGDPFVDAR
ncbi:MAG TPA: mandelate racemase/muconate lactonizing enzyme family protein [Gaiellales bacterium]|nr:mandelate racemase/muconate lactonizing enzyme family protein [Gaiellales bacterium]